MLHGKANRFLRARGHELDAIVQIGKDGITDGLVQATARALLDHELIKIRVNTEAPEDRHESFEALAKATSAELVQVIGRIGLFYKRHPEKPRIQLPKPDRAAKGKAKAAPAAPGPSRPRPAPVAAAPSRSVPDDGDDDGDYN